MSLAELLAEFPELLRSVATRGVTGRTPEQLYAGVDESPLPPTAREDRRVHALASQLAAERFGSTPAFLLGSGKELVQGVGSVLRGQGFFGDSGYDPADQYANEVGIAARRR